MTSDPARVEQLLNEALVRANHIERHVFLTGACGNDTALWNEVWERLRNHTGSLTGRQRRTRGIRVSKSPGVVDEKPGDMVGPYRLLQVLDDSVCSTLWMAERNQRVAEFVAIKIVAAAANDFLIRYEAQKHSLALLDHPDIARPHACGMTPGGRPYLVTELLHGTPITQFCDEQRLSLLMRVRLFIQACDAIHHAHQKGVVHGDLKPSNLLVKWGDQGQPTLKVTDFGIARAMNHALVSPNGHLRTAAAYLSPEHVSGKTVDARSDIYALGMLLYELLTGRLPIPTPKDAAEHLEEVKKLVCETLPATPSACLRSLSRAQLGALAQSRKTDAATFPDLLEEHFDWIVMRTLEKRPESRYPALDTLENDFMGYLKDAAAREEKVTTPAPESGVCQFISAHRGALALVATVVLLLGGGVTTAGWMLLEEKQERTQLAAKRKTEASAMTSLFLQSMFAFLSPATAKEKDPALLRQMLDEAVSRLDTLAENPEAAARAQETLGLAYNALSLPVDAQRQLQGALEKRLLVQGAKHRDTLRTMRELAEAMQAEGRYVDAEALLRKTLRSQQKVLGPDHFDTYPTIIDLAAVCDAQEKYAESETLLLNLHQVQKRVLGPDHLVAFDTLGHLADSYAAQGRYADAMKCRRDQLEGTRRVLGPTAPRTLEVMNATALACEKAGAPAEAEKLCFGALEIMRQSLGAEHPDTLVQTDQAALLLGRRSRHDEALKLLHQSLDAKRRVLGLKHPQIWLSMQNLAREYESQGRQAESEDAQLQALEIMRSAFPPDHADILAQLDTVSQLCDDHGHHAEAAKLRQEALSLRQRVLGSNDGRTLRTMQQLAASLDADGQRAKAVALQLQTLESMKSAYGPGDPDVLAQTRAVAAMYDQHGDYPLAEKTYTELLHLQQRVLGADHAETLATLSGLAAAMGHARRFDEAEALYQQVYDLQRRHAPPDLASQAATAYDLSSLWLRHGQHAQAEPLLRGCLKDCATRLNEHWLRFSIESLLGETLLLQKSLAEAGPLLDSGYQGLNARTTTLPRQARHHLRAAIQRLVEFNETTGNTAKAAEWRQRLAEFDRPPPVVSIVPKISMRTK